nr:MAG TPA_asm: hypothetical protein [Caudoviricetes sp.]
MNIIKGPNFLVNANKIVSAFILTQNFPSGKRNYVLKISLGGIGADREPTFFIFENKDKAQKAFDCLVDILGKSIDNNVQNKIIDLNNYVEKGDK